MLFRQVLYPPTGCASYLLGCLSAERLAVVDPHVTLVDEYLRLAEHAESPIVAIVETHIHADHRSGGQELARRTGVPIYLHEAADVDYDHESVGDGAIIDLGNTLLNVLHTPGHTPDSMTLVGSDRRRGTDEPWFALTGDTLFVGDAGRPDLYGEGSAEAFADQLYDSLFDRLMRLDDYLEVWPAHFSGSACGRSISGKPASTIGFERRWNPALQPRSRQEFVSFMLDELPLPPPGHAAIRQFNRGRAPVAATIR
ncbi:MAG: MBL fold metallo-hydrolase [Dehalococcoidia bacterium]|nr:MBL fold metallo-hydrolase [Dehalococcoidia bacterium]